MADNLVFEEEKQEIEERVVQIDRVTRVVKGGRRLRFRATVVVGDKNGKVGVGIEKGAEVVTAIEKATVKAKKSMETISLFGTTIPHEVTAKFAGAQVFLKPARKGTGVIAGGSIRAVLEVAGVKDVLSKRQGSSSKINNVYASLKALKMLVLVDNSDISQKDKADTKKNTKTPKKKGDK